MINKLKKLLSKPEGLEGTTTSKNSRASFGLIYNHLPVGVLEIKDGKWIFKYTEPFKRQNSIPPLVDFPDVNKVYESEDLWPFFVSRIPSTNRPAVKEVLDKEHIDEKDLAALLSRFGKKTIANPFLLEPDVA